MNQSQEDCVSTLGFPTPYPPIDYEGWLHIAKEFALRGLRESIGAYKKVPTNMRNKLELSVSSYFPLFFRSVDSMQPIDKLCEVRSRMEIFGFDYGLNIVTKIPKKPRELGFARPFPKRGKITARSLYRPDY